MNADDMAFTSQNCTRCGSPLAVQVPGTLCPSCMAGGLFEMTSVDPAACHFTNGTLRVGDYELGEELGRGGMGVVYRARRTGLNRPAAVKLILSGPLASPLERQRFLAEAEAAAALEHPGIVAIYEAGEADGQAWFAMQLIEGESLSVRLRRMRGPLPPREAAQMMLAIARAVQHAHERGFLHRDLKPGNILLDEKGAPHVTDFGLARRMDSEAHLTLTGAAVGTPSYMAPEQTDTRQPPTIAVDVYSLGAILYELLSGHPPFKADSLPELFTAIREKEAASITAVRSEVDRDLDIICRKCLEKEPARRYRSAQALAEDLQHWLNREPITARAVGKTERLWRWCRRRPALASLAAACVLLFIGGVSGVSWQWRRAVDHAAREAEARTVAEDKTRESRRALYAADMNLVQAALRANNLGRARRLLDAHRPSPGEEDLRGWEWRYLWAQCRTGAAAVLVPAEEREVRGVVCSGDGTIAVTNEAWGILRDHEVPGRRIRQTRRANYDNGPLTPHPDGKHFLVPTRHDHCEIWNFDFSRVDPFPITAGLAAAAFSPDGAMVAVQGSSGQVRVFDFKRRAILKDLEMPRLGTGQGGAVAFVPGEPMRLAVGTGDSIRLYRCTDWSEERSWKAHPMNELSALAVSPDGRRLASGACFSDPVVRVWDTATGESVADLKAHTSWISTLVFSRDGAQLYAASADQTISVWHSEKWTHTGTLRGHTDEIWSMNPAGDGLISGCKNGEILVWPGSSAPQAAGRYRFRDETRYVLDAGDSDVIDVRGNYFLRRTPGTWAREPDCPLPGEVQHASSAGLLTYRAASGETGILDTTARPPQLLAELELPPVEKFCADDGNRWLAFAHAERAITLFDIGTRQARQLTSPGDIMELSADEIRGCLIVRTPENVVRWDFASGRWLPPDFPVTPDGVVLCDPGFRWLARLVDEHVMLARIAPFERLVDFNQESNAPSLAFSGDGRWLGIANEAAWARLWRLPEKGPLPEPLVLRGHLNAIFCMAFTPDSSRVVTLCKDNEAAKFWDPETGMELLTLTGNEHLLYNARFTRNGETLLAHRDGHGWHAWHAPSLETIAKVEEKERW
jgi:WD40 repeat protein